MALENNSTRMAPVHGRKPTAKATDTALVSDQSPPATALTLGMWLCPQAAQPASCAPAPRWS
jgi:hypothetical protein